MNATKAGGIGESWTHVTVVVPVMVVKVRRRWVDEVVGEVAMRAL